MILKSQFVIYVILKSFFRQLNMFEYHNHLGFHSHYYLSKDSKIQVYTTFKKALNDLNIPAELDITAIIEVLNKKFMFGDRTILKGLKKTPWMAKPSTDMDSWEFFNVPDHQEIRMDEADITEKFYSLLKDEIREYIDGKKNIAVLLSGGMDSRIVAGIVDDVVSEDKLKNIEITALSWGDETSRDVIYSKRVADRLNWNWKHFPITPELMLQNINITAARGCEFSPVHLHGMALVRNEDFDCILAGSFGDNIGRGEFMRMRVRELVPVEAGFRNVGGFLKQGMYNQHTGSWISDVKEYQERFPQEAKYQQLEQDYQLHHMRRMLNPCMSVIHEKIPVYQAFTSPEVFGFMWSLHPECRTDEIYSRLLQLFKGKLDDIPWARTGVRYGEQNGTPDRHKKSFHNYSYLISRELYSEIRERVLSPEIENLGVFNMRSLRHMFYLLDKLPANSTFYYGERLIWLAALSQLVCQIDVVTNKERAGIRDHLNSWALAPAEMGLRSVKNLF